jgi:hypothetical protein
LTVDHLKPSLSSSSSGTAADENESANLIVRAVLALNNYYTNEWNHLPFELNGDGPYSDFKVLQKLACQINSTTD